MVDSQHGGSHNKQSIFLIELFVSRKGFFDDCEYFFIGNILEILQTIRNSFSQHGSLLEQPTKFLSLFMSKVIY